MQISIEISHTKFSEPMQIRRVVHVSGSFPLESSVDEAVARLKDMWEQVVTPVQSDLGITTSGTDQAS